MSQFYGELPMRQAAKANAFVGPREHADKSHTQEAKQRIRVKGEYIQRRSTTKQRPQCESRSQRARSAFIRMDRIATRLPYPAIPQIKYAPVYNNNEDDSYRESHVLQRPFDTRAGQLNDTVSHEP
jgi:hypothetical protein